MMHIFSMKGLTKYLPIMEDDAAPVLYIPLTQGGGRAVIPIVKLGERVLKYQLIAKANGIFSSNLHSPVSGIVRESGQYHDSLGRVVDYLVLENDFKEESISLNTSNPDALSGDEILSRIEAAGVVGEGGAQFPTHMKYRLEGLDIKTFIINGTECEPYLTADYSLMKYETERILKSALIINRLLKANRVVITLEKRNKDLQDIFRPFFSQEKYRKIEIKLLPDFYPQGSELQLIKSVTGQEIPKGSFPRNYGVIVSNVGTLDAVYKAVYEGTPVIDRIITVSGEKSRNYGNFRVKIGTPVDYILKKQEINTASYDGQVILGGPLMGERVLNDKVAISKGSGGVLFLKNKKDYQENCISCGYCSDVCPMHLQPYLFAEYFSGRKISRLQENNLMQCIECAACEYICPSNVPLVRSIKEGKELLKIKS